MCLYPTLIKNPRYKPNKKNGGKIPPVIDNRVLYVPIGCGNCIECTKKKARHWQTRLLEEIKHTKHAYFVTLTFSNESIRELTATTPNKGYQLDNHIATIATRRFLERWRKTHKQSIKHWLITELGHQGTENIHMHGILWLPSKQHIHAIDKHWQYGFTWKGNPVTHRGKIIDYENYVNDETIGYMTKYITKRDQQHKYYQPIILTSPGIGKQYTKTPNSKRNKFDHEKTIEVYKTQDGHEIDLPTYYRNALYSDDQKEQLWLHKLDKQERWVNGQRIDVSKGFNAYFATLKAARKTNIKLGYRSNKVNFSEKEYEKQLREIQQLKRITDDMNKRIELEERLLNHKHKQPDVPF